MRQTWLHRAGRKAAWLTMLLPALASLAGCRTSCHSRYPAATFGERSTAQLGRTYAQLQRRPRPACNRYGSDLQKVMEVLGTRLSGQPRATVERTMGRPDESSNSLLIYHWRYRHDYLRFRLQADGTAVSSWYYALE